MTGIISVLFVISFWYPVKIFNALHVMLLEKRLHITHPFG